MLRHWRDISHRPINRRCMGFHGGHEEGKTTCYFLSHPNGRCAKHRSNGRRCRCRSSSRHIVITITITKNPCLCASSSQYRPQCNDASWTIHRKLVRCRRTHVQCNSLHHRRFAKWQAGSSLVPRIRNHRCCFVQVHDWFETNGYSCTHGPRCCFCLEWRKVCHSRFRRFVDPPADW